MSKVLLLNDLHFGLKADSKIFRAYIKSFLADQLIPYIKENGIKSIIFLGDFLDKRKYVNIETLQFSRKEFFEPLEALGVTLHMILGNHDVVFRNTSEVNSTTELYSRYSNVKVYSDPTEVNVEGVNVAFIPWINEENIDKFKEFARDSTASIAFGHLEIKGFQVLRGILSESGIDKSEVGMFSKVLSGHFHQKHDDGQIFYLGTQYDMTFADLDEVKGFHTIDLWNSDLEFIPNPRKMFYKIIYDDTVAIPVLDYTKYTNCYVKLVVRKKTKPRELETILTYLYEANPADLSVIEEMDLFIDINDTIDQTKDTVSIICTEIDEMENDISKENLKNIINELYNESYEMSVSDKE